VIRLIAAMDERRGIADDSGIPWQGRIPSDAAYFRTQTTGGVILMGFRTYEEFDRPLGGRTNFVVMRPGGRPLRPGFESVEDLSPFLAAHAGEVVWVIGGAALYAQALPLADELYLTRLAGDFHCTRFFPAFEGPFVLVSSEGPTEEGGIEFRFEVWRASG